MTGLRRCPGRSQFDKFVMVLKHRASRVLCRGHEDEQVAAFSDHKPAAKFHFLVVPKEHCGNPKSLHSEDHIYLLESMLEVGKKVLVDNEANYEDALFGYHWPPFNSIQHLHLHVISPRSQMGFFTRLAYKPNSLWFVTHEWLMDRLKNKNSSSS